MPIKTPCTVICGGPREWSPCPLGRASARPPWSRRRQPELFSLRKGNTLGLDPFWPFTTKAVARMGLLREYLPLSDLGLSLGDNNKANQSRLQALGPATASERTCHRLSPCPRHQCWIETATKDSVGIPQERGPHCPIRSPNTELTIGKIVLSFSAHVKLALYIHTW